MSVLVTVDFGSTYTKLTAIDTEKAEIIATNRSFTTVATHLKDGFEEGLNGLKEKLGEIEIDKIVASSSAAGGLKMIAVGLVPSLTANAAKMAASSAGAKVVATYSYELSEIEKEAIAKERPDIILLSGGIDGGNKEVILNNAKILAEIEEGFSVIVAGNKSVAKEVEDILEKSGKNAILTENVMPEFNKLNIEPARKAIREVFIDRIIEAKGLSEVQEMVYGEIIPTPLACYEACELLAEVGTVMAVDLGGATTDIYSMADGLPKGLNVMLKGLQEPFAKRSVEGDLGMRYSLNSLAEESGLEKVSERLSIPVEEIEEWIKICQNNPSIISDDNSKEKEIDEELAANAVEIAMLRHCGNYETAFTHVGEINVQTGKDLTDVQYIIGAGGTITNSKNAEDIVRRSFYTIDKLNSLVPVNPRIIIDRKNILTSMGLLSRVDKDLALKMMKKEYEIQ